MTCDGLRDELLGFHFGTLDPETRLRVEGHLLGCRGCLGEFLELKRAVEVEAVDAVVPSEASRARLRRAVGEAVRGPRRVPSAAWWERGVALGFAAATVLLSLGIVHAVATSPGALPHGMATEAAGTGGGR